MYDTETATLIRSAPALPGIDMESLPDRLTKIYSELVSLRVKLREGQHEVDSLIETIDFTRKLAQTNEALAIINPDSVNNTAAAFVSATAYKLEFQALNLLPDSNPHAYVNSNSISSDISAMMLFVISGSFADAFDVGKKILLPSLDKFPLQNELISNLISLSQGKLNNILNRKLSSNLDDIFIQNDHNVPEDILYYMILQAIRELASKILDEEAEYVVDPLTKIESVIDLAYQKLKQENFESFIRTPIMFPGPYHLANLLLIMGKTLLEGAITKLSPPNDNISSNEWKSAIKTIAKSRPFLWDNHKKAIEDGYLSDGVSSAINFPTGAGKSIVAQLKILNIVLSQKKVIFLAPTHALVDQTVNDLNSTFPNFSILGDTLTNRDFILDTTNKKSAEVLVMTPESCLQQLCLDPEFFSEYGLLIFDECHLFHPESDNDRRAIDSMLCILNFTYCAPNADILLISAMMSNVEELSNWLSYLTGRESLSISSAWKPTRQIRGCVIYDDVSIKNLNLFIEQSKFLNKNNEYILSAGDKRKLLSLPSALFCIKQTWNSKKRKDYSLVKLLSDKVRLGTSKKLKLTPNSSEVAAEIAISASSSNIKTLIIAQTIRNTVSITNLVNKSISNCNILLNNYELKLLKITIDELGNENELFFKINDNKLVSPASVHHGMLLPQERRLIESIYKRSDDLKVLSCTSTLIEGMNLPAELVIIANDQRYDPSLEKRQMLDADKLLNAAGRAGRAGNFSTGIVLVIPGNIIVFDKKTNEIGKHWSELRQIFSQSDQCLALDDPLTIVLDRIHDQSREKNDIDRYVLSRLAFNNNNNDENSLEKSLKKSFVAFKMNKSNKEEWMESRIESANKIFFEKNLDDSEVSNKLRILESTLGLPIDLLQRLSTDLLNVEIETLKNVFELSKWMFSWISNNPDSFTRFIREEDIGKIFGKDYTDLSEGNEKVNFAVPKFHDGLIKWMNGFPLNEIQLSFSQVPHYKKNCMSARRFVIRKVPELAHLMSIPVKIIELANDISLEVPTPISPALKYLYSCVRNGYSSAEMAEIALKSEFSTLSRRELHDEFNEIKKYLSEPDENESIESFESRVRLASDRYINITNLENMDT